MLLGGLNPVIDLQTGLPIVGKFYANYYECIFPRSCDLSQTEISTPDLRNKEVFCKTHSIMYADNRMKTSCIFSIHSDVGAIGDLTPCYGVNGGYRPAVPNDQYRDITSSKFGTKLVVKQRWTGSGNASSGFYYGNYSKGVFYAKVCIYYN